MGFKKRNSRAEIAKKAEICLFYVLFGLFWGFIPSKSLI
jgi:hypothetical protein